MKTINKQIEETENKLKELKSKKIIEDNNSNWIRISELGIEIQGSIHDKNKSYDELVEIYGKESLEKSLPTYAQLQFLRNSKKYVKKLNLTDTYELVKQEDTISRKNGYVARFCAGSGYCDLICYWVSDDSGSDLGVRFVRELKK